MNLGDMISVITSNPQFAVMKGMGRFGVVRKSIQAARSLSQRRRWARYCEEQKAQLGDSIFRDVDPCAFTQKLVEDGVVTGLHLPDSITDGLLEIAQTQISYADRDPRWGFPLSARKQAEEVLGKPILLAQYFNMDRESEEVTKIRDDPFLLLVSALYLRSTPVHISTNMWWTFPVKASEEDRIKNAHYFHQDFDDFAFVKFFFYLTDVDADDGAHICVPGSHRSPLIKRPSDYWTIRRYYDHEVEERYGRERILAIGGKKGTGFAEDTVCIHKGATPVRAPRLCIQFQYALFDYLMQHDNVDPSRMKRIV